MKADKAVIWTINLLLAAAFCAAVLVFAEQIHASGWEWFSRVLACWPIFICFAAGVAVREKKINRPLPCIGAIIVAAVIMYLLFPARDLGHCLYMGLAALLGIYMYCIGLRGDEAYPPRMAIITVALLLVECIWFSKADRADMVRIPALAGLTLGAFLLSMFSFNAAGITSGLHNTKTGQKLSVPAGLRIKNMLMLVVFLVIALLISLIEPLRSVFSLILTLIINLAAWISDVMGSEQQMPTGGSGGGSSSIEPQTVPDVPVNRPMQITFYILMGLVLIIAAVIIIAVIVSLNAKGERGGAKGNKRRSRRRKKYSEETEYDDSVERLLDLRGFVQRRRDRISERLKKITRRPQRIDDMPDDRSKVRFAYYSFLRSNAGRNISRTLTPLEVSQRRLAESVEKLAVDYSSVRYNEASVPDTGAAANAFAAMSAMKKK